MSCDVGKEGGDNCTAKASENFFLFYTCIGLEKHRKFEGYAAVLQLNATNVFDLHVTVSPLNFSLLQHYLNYLL
eukprot:s1719_g8.t1